MWLANDLIEFRGAEAVANGWIQRARRLLDGLEPVPEHAWMALYEAMSALMGDNDPVAAHEAAQRAAELARELGVFDVEMAALATDGLALVTAGRVAEGMRLLDEAATAAVADEVQDAAMRSTILCSLMDACDRVRDFDRAAQWCARAREVSERWGLSELFSLCRPHYAVVLTWRGAWDEAEAELESAIEELSARRPPMAAESIVRLAELRTLQGRLDDAAVLFEQVEHAPLAQLGRARLALAIGDASMAVELCERFLRRIPPDDRVERAAGLELMVRARIAAENPALAEDPSAELRAAADEVQLAPLQAAACVAAGLLARARGDRAAARRAFEEAVDRYGRASAPYEAACARLELAVELGEAGLATSARREASAALKVLGDLGAVLDARRAANFIASFDATEASPIAPTPIAPPAGLTEREVEVLRLIAIGRSNREIADDLVLSVRTVERHISNLYGKLGVDGRTARAAATAHAFRLGLLLSS
jgi:ATP/maltotriose-dependent transcriptional regulator MalT